MAKKIKKVVIICLMVGFFMALPVSVLAITDNGKQSVHIAADEIVDGNFVVMASVIDIAGSVNGDVIVAGNNITISGSVAGDVIAVGEVIKITGEVGGSVRVAGNVIEINGTVKNNAWTVGSNVIFGDQSAIGWDIYSYGKTAEIKSAVGGSVWISGENVVINGSISKDCTAYLVDRKSHLTINSEAIVQGNLVYKADSENQLVKQSAAVVAGETIREPMFTREKKEFSVFSLMMKIIVLFSFLVVGLILISLMPKKILELKEEMVQRPWRSLGMGFGYLVITPVVVLLLLITVIGIPLALIITSLYLSSLYILKVLVGISIGSLILDNVGKKKYSGSLVWPLVLGLIVMMVIAGIPIIGGVVGLLLILWATGALIYLKRESFKKGC